MEAAAVEFLFIYQPELDESEPWPKGLVFQSGRGPPSISLHLGRTSRFDHVILSVAVVSSPMMVRSHVPVLEISTVVPVERQ